MANGIAEALDETSVKRNAQVARSSGSEKKARAGEPPGGNAKDATDAGERGYAEKDLRVWTVADAAAWMQDTCPLSAEDRGCLVADGVDGVRLREMRGKDFRLLGLSCRCCFNQMLRKRDALLS